MFWIIILPLSYQGVFCNVCYKGESLWPPREFFIKHLTFMNWVPGASYRSFLTIDTKISTNISCMTWLWCHNRRHVKNSANCPKSSKSRVVAIFVTKMCTYVVVIGVRVHLGMAFIKLSSIKYNFASIYSLKHEKPHFCAFPIEKHRVGRNDPLPSTFDGTPWPRWRWNLRFFSPKWPQKDEFTIS